MRDRGPVIIAMTVSTIAVLATCVGAFLALAYATRPVAFGIGGAGLAAALLGLFAVVQWMRDAAETYPDYRYHRALSGGLSGLHPPAPASETAPAGPRAKASLGDNVVMFDPLRARRKHRPAG